MTGIGGRVVDCRGNLFHFVADSVAMSTGAKSNKEYPVSRLYRNVKKKEIGKGTNGIRRIVITRSADRLE